MPSQTDQPKNRLLIIDDETEFSGFVASVARGCGYATTEECDSEKTLDHFSHQAPTHVILDLAMPRVDGISILRQLAGCGCAAKVVIVSGYDQKVLDTAKRIAVERGLVIAGTLTKPVRAVQLRSLLNEIACPAGTVDRDAISRALISHEMYLAYQPKVDLEDRSLAGFEALLRWRHPVNGLISPAEFIPLAETLGLIDDVTELVIESAIKQLHAWNQAGFVTGVSINISAQNLRSTDFPDRLEARCREAGVTPKQLTLELTETAATGDLIAAMDILARLRLKDFGLSIDDFGTGHSSLVQLHRLPFSELKIDRFFVSECTVSANAAQIVNSIIGLCQSIGLRSVAEGIEDEATLCLLREFGCVQGQGFVISRPLAVEDVGGWTQDWNSGVAAGFSKQEDSLKRRVDQRS